MAPPSSVIVVEDQTVLRETLVQMLDCIEIFTVAGDFGDAGGALAFLERREADVALIDYDLPDMDGASFFAKARVLRPALRGLFLSMHTTAQHIRRAFEAGAAGYLPETVKTDELLTALEQVAKGEPYISPALSLALIGAMITPPVTEERGRPALTAGQAGMLRLASRGLTTAAIARELGITLAAAKHRFAAIYRHLGARDRGEALIKAARLGIIE